MGIDRVSVVLENIVLDNQIGLCIFISILVEVS
jgi:hypothetical protein